MCPKFPSKFVSLLLSPFIFCLMEFEAICADVYKCTSSYWIDLLTNFLSLSVKVTLVIVAKLTLKIQPIANIIHLTLSMGGNESGSDPGQFKQLLDKALDLRRTRHTIRGIFFDRIFFSIFHIKLKRQPKGTNFTY